MDNTFDVDAFITRIGTRLVAQFDDARTATSPSTVGAAMEQPVKKQLEQILPKGIAVGSGFVIDSHGTTSRQADVVLYEKDICPVFSINDTPETTYYPCEGVIAVGEVKSTLDRQSLRDAFTKIASVKRLKRFTVYHPVPFPDTGKRPIMDRNYGALHDASPLTTFEGEEISETAQILGFVLAGANRLQSDSLCESFREIVHQTGDTLSPNLIVMLSGGLLRWGNITNIVREIKQSEGNGKYSLSERSGKQARWEESWSAQHASFFQFSEEADSFRTLIRWINEIYRTGKTSSARAFDQYFLQEETPNPDSRKVIPKANDVTLEETLQRMGMAE